MTPDKPLGAMENIKRMEEMLADNTWTNTPWRSDDAPYLLRAFKVMREIALAERARGLKSKAHKNLAADFLDGEFEEAMNKAGL